MSFPTKPAFVYDFPNGDFDEQTRAHPAVRFLETYLRGAIEKGRWTEPAHSIGHRHDSFLKTGGKEVVQGADDHLEAVGNMFAQYTECLHECQYIVVWEVADGWMSLGTANLYFNTSQGQKDKVKSHDGRSWDGVAPGAYKVHYAKDSNGEVQLAGVEIYNEAHH